MTPMKLILIQYCGDTVTHSIPMSWAGADFTPGSSWDLIFTAKRTALDPDTLAVFQKKLGVGITVTGSTAAVAVVGQDTEGLEEMDLVWDIRATNPSTGARQTVANGRLTLARDVSRSVTTSIPVYTSDPPITLGILTSGEITLALGYTPADAATLTVKADLVSGKVPTSQLPAMAQNTFLGVVTSQAAMLALTGNPGNWCNRSDLGQTFVVIAAPTSILANWQALDYPVSPVLSVNGQTGTIVLAAADVSAAPSSTVSFPGFGTGTPAALGIASTGIASTSSRSDHVHPLPSLLALGAAPASGIQPSAITGTAVVTLDSRLSDARTPITHAASHHTGGSDALTPANIGAATATQGAKADTSLQTSNTSTGGNGAADSGKVVIFDTNGYILAGSIQALSPANSYSYASLLPNGELELSNSTGYAANIRAYNLTANRQFDMPDIDGTIPAIPTFANDTSAKSAGLVAGDQYFTGSKFTTVAADTAATLKTSAFTAAVGNSYKCDGTFAVTDPSTAALDDTYTCLIVGGSITIGGVVYTASQITKHRRYNGSSWETLANTFTNLTTFNAGFTVTAGTITLPASSISLSAVNFGTVGATLAAAATIDAARQAIGEVSVTKGSDTSRNNTTTLATDSALDIAVAANTTYRVFFSIVVTDTSNCGIKAAFLVPSVSSLESGTVGNVGMLTNVGGSVVVMNMAASSGLVGASAMTNTFNTTRGRFTGFFEVTIGATGGTMHFQWAQNTSHTDNATVCNGSRVTCKQLNP